MEFFDSYHNQTAIICHVGYFECSHQRSQTFCAESKRFSFNANFLLNVLEKSGRRLLNHMLHSQPRFYIFNQTLHKTQEMVSRSYVTRNRTFLMNQQNFWNSIKYEIFGEIDLYLLEYLAVKLDSPIPYPHHFLRWPFEVPLSYSRTLFAIDFHPPLWI